MTVLISLAVTLASFPNVRVEPFPIQNAESGTLMVPLIEELVFATWTVPFQLEPVILPPETVILVSFSMASVLNAILPRLSLITIWDVPLRSATVLLSIPPALVSSRMDEPFSVRVASFVVL